jgi:hypothetical protein
VGEGAGGHRRASTAVVLAPDAPEPGQPVLRQRAVRCGPAMIVR